MPAMVIVGFVGSLNDDACRREVDDLKVEDPSPSSQSSTTISSRRSISSSVTVGMWGTIEDSL